MIRHLIKTVMLFCALLSTAAYADPAAIWVDSYTPTPELEIKSAVTLKNTTFGYKKEIPTIVLEPLDQPKTTLQTRAYQVQHANTLGTPLSAGVKRQISATETVESFHSLLDWETLADGSHLAALSVISPQATGNRFILNIEQLDPRAELRFIDHINDETLSVSGESIINTVFRNKQASADLDGTSNLYVSPYLNGEQVTLEIHLPKEVAVTEIKLALPYVSHIFLAPSELEQVNQRHSDQSCMKNVACDSSWNDVSDGVARMLFTDAYGDSYICTGTLLNDKQNSGTPYFLTADHCISSQQEASTLQTFWFYKSSSCYASVVNNYTRLYKGADLLFNQASTDTALLRLRDAAPRYANYQGWTTSSAKNTYVGVIHHPDGQPQKLATGYTEQSYADCSTTGGGEDFLCRASQSNTAGYLPVSYNNSATEGGSSGSGLFITANNNAGTASSRYLVGQLLGGNSSCKTPDGIDVYGRFDLAYRAGLATWLAAEKPISNNNDKSAIFRFYNTKSATHFFTGSVKERDSVISKYASFIYEGQAFYAYPKNGSTLSPVYRFYHKVRGSHFYTISKSEKESIERTYPNYIYEGVAWYAAPTAVTGSKPLYRFYNTKTGTHFYTVNATEKDNIISKYASYIYEGIAYHVWVK